MASNKYRRTQTTTNTHERRTNSNSLRLFGHNERIFALFNKTKLNDRFVSFQMEPAKKKNRYATSHEIFSPNENIVRIIKMHGSLVGRLAWALFLSIPLAVYFPVCMHVCLCICIAYLFVTESGYL